MISVHLSQKNNISSQFLLHWQVMFLLVIVFFAAWHHISLRGSATPGDGHEMLQFYRLILRFNQVIM